MDELKKLWRLLSGSANQDVPDSVFAAAHAYQQEMDYTIRTDETMDRGDLYYQDENTQMIAVIDVLRHIASGQIPGFVAEMPF
jgi:hypothetical protein